MSWYSWLYFILCTSNTLFHCLSSSSTSFVFGNHSPFPKFSDRAFSKAPHPLPSTWMEHKTQAWPTRVSSLLASNWFRNGHVTEAGSINLPWEFYSAKDEGNNLFLLDLLCQEGEHGSCWRVPWAVLFPTADFSPGVSHSCLLLSLIPSQLSSSSPNLSSLTIWE